MSQNLADYRVGRPFGDGSDGDLTISSNATWGTGTPSVPIQSCSGTVGTTSLTIAAADSFANGDLILIHHSRGTTQNTGGWEVNRIVSGGGGTTLTLADNLDYTYTDSGADQSQVIKILEYDDVTLNSGITWTIPAWGGNTGGIMAFAFRGTFTWVGTISGVGANGTDNNDGGQPGNQGGFRGGQAVETAQPAGQGEGTGGDRGTTSSSANGNGGGGGDQNTGLAAGGGGGNGATGSTGSQNGNGVGGTGGEAAGAANLSTILFGGAGGGANGGADQGSGANGGATLLLFGKILTVTGSLNLNGGNGGAGSTGGGGGAGGSFLLKCQTATLGSNLLTATGGNGGTGSIAGGAGGTGRNSVHHSGTVTGTTNPTFNDTTDGTLTESDAAFLFNIL